MAEAVFLHIVKTAGLEEHIETDSAGTGAWHSAEPPHTRTRAILNKYGIEYQHLARQITDSDFEYFDYILTMDEANYDDVASTTKGKAIVRRMMEFAVESDVIEVPDPYYTGGFEGVFGLVSQGSEGLLAAIRHEHQL